MTGKGQLSVGRSCRMSVGLVKLPGNGQHVIPGKRRRGSGFPPPPTRGRALCSFRNIQMTGGKLKGPNRTSGDCPGPLTGQSPLNPSSSIDVHDAPSSGANGGMVGRGPIAMLGCSCDFSYPQGKLSDTSASPSSSLLGQSCCRWRAVFVDMRKRLTASLRARSCSLHWNRSRAARRNTWW